MRALLDELRVFGTHERLAERIGYYLARIRQLYAVEWRAKELTSEEHQQLRQTESLPLLESFGRWLVKQSQRVLPKSPIGGRAAAVLFSMTASCKRHGIDPFVWLRDILRNLPTQPSDRLVELLPDVWFADHPEAKRKKVA